MESEGRMKERNRGLSLWLILAFLGCIGGAKGEEIMNLHTEKSMYAPGETAGRWALMKTAGPSIWSKTAIRSS